MPACVRRLFKFSDTNFIANLYRSNKVIWHSLQDFTFRSFITSSGPTSPKSKGGISRYRRDSAIFFQKEFEWRSDSLLRREAEAGKYRLRRLIQGAAEAGSLRHGQYIVVVLTLSIRAQRETVSPSSPVEDHAK